jgi:two-component system chemotaxis response regulator CheB
MSRVRVLVVDDSPTMQVLISSILSREPQIEVVGVAGDPLEAREAIKQLNPDVITLDIEMPKMDGIEFLDRLMRLRPMPVIMVSTLTQAGADATLRALELGAFDCIGKPDARHAASGFSELTSKVLAAAGARVRSAAERRPAAPVAADFRPNGRVVAIGSSTGGVEALVSLLEGYPANCPPTVITQHMPATFTRSFAERLNRLSAAEVREAEDGAPLVEGRVYVAPGGERHLTVVRGAAQVRCRLVAGDLVSGHRPSVDMLFRSIAAAFAANAVGVILTGMGRDGAEGILEMRQAGAATLGQDQATSVVYGMPKVAFEIGGVARQLPLHKIRDEILARCSTSERESV